MKRRINLLFVNVALCVWLLAAASRDAFAGQRQSGVTGDDPQYIIQTWETAQGLPENSATAILQTADGYLWFGTFSGLVRFDGVKFTVFDPSNMPELPSGSVVNLHLDRADCMWISTYKGLVARQADGHWRRFNDRFNTTDDVIRTFIERGDGDMLMRTFSGDLLVWSNDRIEAIPGPLGAKCMGTPFVDERGRWRVIENDQEWLFDNARWELVGPWRADDGRAVVQADSHDGGNWFFTGRSLIKRTRAGELQRRMLADDPGEVWSMLEDDAGNLWVATIDNGVWRVAPDGAMRRWSSDTGLAYEGVRCVFEDREHNIWVGTSGGGLSRFKPRRFRTFGVSEGLTERVVKSVAPAGDGSLMIATYGKGLFRLADGHVQLVGQFGGYAQSVLCDRRGRTWLGVLGDGCWVIENGQPRQLPAADTGGNNVIALFEDTRGRMWVSGGQSIAVFDGDAHQNFTRDQGVPSAGVCCFAEDAQHRIWLSDATGVFRLEGERFVEVRDRESRSITDIICLKPGPNDSMWMGSRGGGLLRWRDGSLQRIDARHGLPVRSVHGMIDDAHGHWWLASNAGIVRVPYAELEAVADGRSETLLCQLLDSTDGLTSVECPGGQQPTCARDARGCLWFATLRGVAMIDPLGFRLNDAPPLAHVEQVAFVRPRVEGDAQDASDRPVAERRAFIAATGTSAAPQTLPAGSRQIEVHYTALSFAAPEKVRFQIRLDGQDDQWQDVGTRRVAYYHDLAPGDYTFRVRAQNNDGIWSEREARAGFTITPYLWQARWFRAMAIAAAVFLSAGIAWFVAHARQRQRRLADDRFRQVVEATPNAMVVVNSEGCIVFCNARTQAYFGYTPAELAGQSIELLVPDDSRTAHAGLRIAYMAQPTSRAMGAGRELFGRRKDGSRVPVEIGLNPIRTPQGQFVLASIVDVSERKRRELESAQHRSELAHLSRVTMLGELSGSLAHELNQPLMAILSNAQAAQRYMNRQPADLNEVREILADIVEQDQRAGEVIRRLRLLLKKGEVQLQPQDMGDVVHDVLKLVHSDLINHNVSVRVELADNLPRVVGDRVQLQQVLLNLVMNACDALADARGDNRTITVRVEAVNHDVRVSVIDRGCGIAPGQLEHIFEPFVTSKAHGMGLGLAVCRSIISAHDGRLWAEHNQPARANGAEPARPLNVGGRGATMLFTLPACPETDA